MKPAHKVRKVKKEVNATFFLTAFVSSFTSPPRPWPVSVPKLKVDLGCPWAAAKPNLEACARYKSVAVR